MRLDFEEHNNSKSCLIRTSASSSTFSFSSRALGGKRGGFFELVSPAFDEDFGLPFTVSRTTPCDGARFTGDVVATFLNWFVLARFLEAATACRAAPSTDLPISFGRRIETGRRIFLVGAGALSVGLLCETLWFASEARGGFDTCSCETRPRDILRSDFLPFEGARRRSDLCCNEKTLRSASCRDTSLAS